jgi:hypothetical protein
VHAAFDFAVFHPELTQSWHDESNYLVVVTTENEKTLAELQSIIEFDLKLRHIGVTEPDMDDELTAVAVEPSDDVRRLLSSLPLLGKPGGGGTT